jgi:hypothetical protein
MALADTELIALLNHDDVWLPDHLERASEALVDADLYIGRAARATHHRETPEGVEPVFRLRSPLRRRLGHAFHDAESAFEPCSAWVFRARLAADVGPWRLAREVHRPPADDWLLRAWRRGPRVRFGTRIGVLQLLTHYREERPDGCYAATSRVHAGIEALLARKPPDVLRAEIEATVPTRRRSPLAHALRKPLRGALVNPLTAAVYRGTGLDAHALYCSLARRRRGHVLRRASVRRTGVDLPPPPDRRAMLAAARRLLAPATV